MRLVYASTWRVVVARQPVLINQPGHTHTYTHTHTHTLTQVAIEKITLCVDDPTSQYLWSEEEQELDQV